MFQSYLSDYPPKYSEFFTENQSRNFLNFSNWFYCNRSSIARDKIKTVQLTQKVARTDLELSDSH
jgi:hypothetical protein